MKPIYLISISFLAVTAVMFAACGNDDDDGDNGGDVCVDYCGEVESVDCLGEMSLSDCELGCQLLADDEDCGTEYTSWVQCGVNNGLECIGIMATYTGCDTEEETYISCEMDPE